MVLGLCERFHCLPSQLEEEQAEIIRLVQIQQKGHPEKDKGGQEDEEEE